MPDPSTMRGASPAAAEIPDLATMPDAARRIAAAAEALFYERGITAVGVDRIAEASGVTKRTLYDRFGSKDVLVAVYLTERDRRWRALVEEAVAAAPDTHAALLAPFDALERWMGGTARGCAFVNALAELPDASHPGRAVILEQKRWLEARLCALATAAGASDAATLAARLLVLHEGALATQPLDLGTLPVVQALARELVDRALA
ncbi:helix-turn-helix domain containing protein [Agrococcus sp. SL85]|uniref:TetR/AcrR family transcriptional regulator n=1 Tax=Agrococcus sp. SL85 TaxID=2995141 RepID=UPI00226CA7E1|nr:TetR/AcrR family transcriptional regulator [Agrococcus sp. SL85]WAC66904.1 helix-turn-helix domain containing protein [Agrococcus sp. SL85]